MSDPITPTSEEALADIVRAAASENDPLEILGGGTRRDVGRPVQAGRSLSTAGLTGVTLYEPGALTLIARAGTPLAEVEATLAAEGQRLVFEPGDWRGLMGSTGEPTIGGAVAVNLSGPRRIQAGACRDSLIGVRFVDGRGEINKNGGRVMKNVTGYDLVKLLCGSYGTLGVLTEVAFKVGPAPERSICLMLKGLDDERAAAALSAGLVSPYEVSGAAHLPADCAPDGDALTMLRLEGFAENMAHRGPALRDRLAAFGAAEIVEDPEELDAAWRHIRDAAPFAGSAGAVWRISVKPTDGPGVGAALRDALGARVFYDWGGGLIWALVAEEAGGGDAGAATLRASVAARGGHATLIRASAAVRAAVPVFQPEHPRLARISADLKQKFDPAGALNPGRMAA